MAVLERRAAVVPVECGLGLSKVIGPTRALRAADENEKTQRHTGRDESEGIGDAKLSLATATISRPSRSQSLLVLPPSSSSAACEAQRSPEALASGPPPDCWPHPAHPAQLIRASLPPPNAHHLPPPHLLLLLPPATLTHSRQLPARAAALLMPRWPHPLRFRPSQIRRLRFLLLLVQAPHRHWPLPSRAPSIAACWRGLGKRRRRSWCEAGK